MDALGFAQSWGRANTTRAFYRTSRHFKGIESRQSQGQPQFIKDIQIFRTLLLDLSQAISLVIVSDGILDQKGGAKGLSLGRRRLKNLLEKAVTEDTVSEVLDGDHLMRAIHEYRGDEEQRDDMTLIVLSLRG